eukprot:gene3208-4019_t
MVFTKSVREISLPYSLKSKAEQYSQILFKLFSEAESTLDFKFNLNELVLSLDKEEPFQYLEYKYISRLSEHILEAVEIILQSYLVNQDIQSYFPEANHLKDVLSFDKIQNLTRLNQISRFDMIKNENGQFGVLELNTAHPGGLLMIPYLKSCYEEKNQIDMAEKYKINFLPVSMDDLYFWFKHLTQFFQEVRNTNRNPCIAYINHATFRTIKTDMEEFLFLGEKYGYDVMVGTYDQLEYNGEFLSINGKRIDIVWNKIDSIINENGNSQPCMYEHSLEEVKPMMEAYKDKKVLFVNSLLSEVVSESKKILAILRDPEFQYLFNREQQIAIQELILPTFVLNSKSNRFLELKNQISKKKDEFVIKSSYDTRGRMIFIGKQCSQEEWDQLVLQSVDKPYVIQKFIHSKSTMVCDPKTGTEIPMTSTLAFFLVGGRSSGYIVRSSPSLIHNVYGGVGTGILQPTYVFQDDDS